MRRLSGLILVMFFIVSICVVSVCEAIDIYTFKKDRVDQSLDGGNRGYISGTPPAEPEDRNTKRTLIGVDIELPMTSSTLNVEGAEVTIQPKEKIKPTASSQKKVTLVEEEVVEEEYIK